MSETQTTVNGLAFTRENHEAIVRCQAELEALDRLLEQRLDMMDKALELQNIETLRRLDTLNHAHEKAIQVQNTYLPREVFESYSQTPFLQRSVFEGYTKEQVGKDDLRGSALLKVAEDARQTAADLVRSATDRAEALALAVDRRQDLVDGRLAKIELAEKELVPREVFQGSLADFQQWRTDVETRAAGFMSVAVFNSYRETAAKSYADLMPRSEVKLLIDNLGTRLDSIARTASDLGQALATKIATETGESEGVSRAKAIADRNRNLFFASTTVFLTVVAILITIMSLR